MYDEEPHITEEYAIVYRTNPISGHSWPEKGKITGYIVRGGGWMPMKHKTLKGAKKDLAERKLICEERLQREKDREKAQAKQDHPIP